MNPGDNRPAGQLSDSECEELLAGRRTDLPVGAILNTLQGPLGAELPGEAAAMAAFRAAATGVPTITRRGRASARVVAASIGSSVVLLGGVAAAASGQVRHDIGDVLGVHEHHSAPAHHGPLPMTASPTPGAPALTPSPTSTATSSANPQPGKAHQGHGKGHGVGETAQPGHPAHPTQAATPTHPAHPTKKPHPTQAATPTHKPSHHSHPTRKPHPTQAATPTRRPTHSPSGGH